MKWVNLQQAAEEHGISRSLMRSWIRRRVIDGVKADGEWEVELDSIKGLPETLKFDGIGMPAELRPMTVREIKDEFCISSTSVVNYRVNRMVEVGLRVRTPDVARSIRPANLVYAEVELA